LIGVPHLRRLDLSNTSVSNLEPIKACKSLNTLILDYTGVYDLSAVVDLPKLEELRFANTQVSELSPVASLPVLRRLDLSGTRVSDLSALVNSKTLETLNINKTDVSDISALSSLTSLRYLYLMSSKVSDLSALAHLTNLVRAAQDGGGGIFFNGCPLTNSTLLELCKLQNPDRTVQVISYLRTTQGLPPLASTSSTADWINYIENNDLGARFEPAGKVFAIVGHNTKNDRIAAGSALVRSLHRPIVRKSRTLVEQAKRVNNQPGWEELFAASERFHENIDSDLDDIADRIAVIWAELVSLGSFIDQDDGAQNYDASLIDSLEPDTRRALVDLVQTAAPWLRQFPTALKLDENHASFETQKDDILLARQIFKTAEEKNIFDRSAASLIGRALDGHANLGDKTKKSQHWGLLSVRNVIVISIAVSAGEVANGFLERVGHGLAEHTILSEKSGEFIEAGGEHIRRFLENLPADVRQAVDSILHHLRKQADAPPKGAR
jgi:hypothetical protein